MKYTVCWREETEQKLNEIWNDAADKMAISEAANAIEVELRLRPIGPLAIFFRVNELDRRVDVWSVFRV